VLAALGFSAWFLLSDVAPSSGGPSADTGTNSFPDNTYIPYPSTAPGSSAGTPDEQAARAAYEAALSADNPDNIKAGQTVAVSGYALQLWTGDNTGGEALLKFDSAQNAWIILDPGGGEWSLEGLVGMGVPQETAQALLAGVFR
jgi:hypothetical protein